VKQAAEMGRGRIFWSRGRLLLCAGGLASESCSIAGLIFDLGGTLDADGVAWRDRFLALLDEEFAGLTASEFTRAIDIGEQALLRHERAAAFGLAEMVATHVAAQLDALGCSDRRRQEALSSRFYDETLRALRGRRPLLERLARRLPLAVASNGCGNTRRLLAEAGIEQCFRVVVDSSEVGAWKPDAGILQPAIAALGQPPAKLAMVGDRLDRDVAVALAAGVRTVWVKAGATAGDSRWLAAARAKGYGVDAVVASVEQLDPGGGR